MAKAKEHKKAAGKHRNHESKAEHKRAGRDAHRKHKGGKKK